MLELKIPLFENIDPKYHEILETISHVHTASEPQELIRKGAEQEYIYILLEGSFEIVGCDDFGELKVAVLSTFGDVVGESAILGGKAVASVSVKKGTRYYALNASRLERRSDLRHYLSSKIARRGLNKLSRMYEVEMKNKRERIFISKTVIMTFSILCLSVFYSKFTDFIGLRPNILWSWLYLIAFTPLVAAYVSHSRSSLEYYGIAKVGAYKSIADGLFFSFVFVLLYCLSILVYSKFSFGFLEQVLLNFFKPSIGLSMLYLAHCYFQEFLARGVLQKGLHGLIDIGSPKVRLFIAVFIASLAFGVTHDNFGFWAMIMTTLAGIVYGYVYVRTNNILGVTIFHFFSGKCFFMLLMALSTHSGYS